MPKPLSFDLRSRVLAAIDGGLSCRQAAARFGVGASRAIRRQALRRPGSDGRRKRQGGDRLSRRTETHGDRMRASLDATPGLTLARNERAACAVGRPREGRRALAFLQAPQADAQKRRRRPPSRIGPAS
jgi:transposase